MNFKFGFWESFPTGNIFQLNNQVQKQIKYINATLYIHMYGLTVYTLSNKINSKRYCTFYIPLLLYSQIK